ncbi:hypothetical protein F5888DRAFT_1868232 [Russula emetica]|nr:hypothetical protein F5888DRAFT_1868232 [Russula emetica]
MEREMCSYLEWQLNVDPTTLRNFQARVQQDFADPGPYPPMVLPQPAPASFSHQNSSPVEGPVIPHSHGSNSTLVKPAKAVASATLTSLAVAPKKPKSACGQFVYATRADLTDPSLLAQTVYFGRCLPWIIIDAIPCFRKLQPNKVPMPEEQWECTKGVLFSHFTVEGPAIFLFHPVAESFGMSTWQLHHKYSAPFGLAAEYAHPLEVMILGTGTILGPLSTVGPLMPIPDTSGAEYHDFHHMAFVKNFSTLFCWWDRLLGTDKKYLAYGERVCAATKGLDAAQRKAVEEKMVVAEEEAIPM